MLLQLRSCGLHSPKELLLGLCRRDLLTSSPSQSPPKGSYSSQSETQGPYLDVNILPSSLSHHSTGALLFMLRWGLLLATFTVHTEPLPSQASAPWFLSLLFCSLHREFLVFKFNSSAIYSERPSFPLLPPDNLFSICSFHCGFYLPVYCL